MPPTPSPSETPPAALLESIKQGNAIELELIKKMRDGLDTIVEGLQQECYNRSDACDELIESLGAMHLDLKAPEKGELEELVKEGVRTCSDIGESERVKHDLAVQERCNRLNSDFIRLTKIGNQLVRHRDILDRTEAALSALCQLESSPAANELHEQLINAYKVKKLFQDMMCGLETNDSLK